MKNSIILFVSITLSSYAMAQQSYQEKVFVFTLDIDSVELAQEDCDAGVAALAEKFNIHDIVPTSTVRVRINSVKTWALTSKVLNYEVGDVGTLLLCQDIHPEDNQGPAYYEITIKGRKYIAAGGGSSPEYPEFPKLPGGGVIYTPAGFPTETTAVEVYGATVLPSRAGKPGGVYVGIGLHQHGQGPDLQFQSSFLGVLRVYHPIKDGSE